MWRPTRSSGTRSPAASSMPACSLAGSPWRNAASPHCGGSLCRCCASRASRASMPSSGSSAAGRAELPTGVHEGPHRRRHGQRRRQDDGHARAPRGAPRARAPSPALQGGSRLHRSRAPRGGVRGGVAHAGCVDAAGRGEPAHLLARGRRAQCRRRRGDDGALRRRHGRRRGGAQRPARLQEQREGRAPAAPPPERSPLPARLRVAVARDAAFSFYYRDNLDRLAAAGAELVGWSPLADAALPAGTRLLYLGGGYPEVHAPRLAANAAARAAVREFAAAGGAIYAECGGLMYLAEMLRTLDGTPHPMCGVLPLAVRMEPRLAALGYVEVAIALDDGPPLRARGHEFRHSTLEGAPAAGLETAYEVRDARGGSVRREGYRRGGTLASYVHPHFGSCPELPVRLLARAAR